MACLTHLWPMFPFYTPWKHQKVKGSLGVWNVNIGHKWLKEIWQFVFIYTKFEKVTNVFRKCACSILRISTRMSLLWVTLNVLSFFIFSNASLTLTHENWNVHLLVTLLIAMMLGYFLYLKIAFNIGCDISSAMWWTSLKSEIFRFLTRFEKKEIKSFAFLASRAKISLPSACVISPEDAV